MRNTEHKEPSPTTGRPDIHGAQPDRRRRVPRRPAAGMQRQGMGAAPSKEPGSLARTQPAPASVDQEASSDFRQSPSYPPPPSYLSPVAVRCWHQLWTRDLDRSLFNERHVDL